MAKTTTFQIKFENYDKSFKNINAITSELADMNASLKQLEEEFAKADFGSDEWKELAKNINETENLIKGFTQEIENSTEITNKALQSSIETQKELQTQSEETKKALEEAFSPEAIVEFSAKASAAFIGLGEAFGGTGGEAIKSVERIQKALITVNAIKDSAEVAVLSFRKLNTVLANWSLALEKGGKSASLLGKGVDLLGKGLKSPLVIFTAIIGVVTTLTAVFGDLANVINFVSDSVGGLVNGFKALISFENPFTAFGKEFERLGKLRDAEKNVAKFALETQLSAAALEKLNQKLELSNNLADKRKFTNEIYKETLFLTNQELDAQEKLIEVTTDKQALEEAQVKLQELRAKAIQLETQNTLANQQITLDSIEVITNAIDISNQKKIRGLENELLYNTANSEKSIELINKIVDADEQGLKTKIANLSSLTFLDQAQQNELAQLKSDLDQKEAERKEKIKSIIISSGQVERALFDAKNKLLIDANNRQLQFIDLRTQKGVDAANELIKANAKIQEESIKLELEKFDQIKNLTAEEEIAKTNLINSLAELEIQTNQQIYETQKTNLELLSNQELTQIELNAKQRQIESEKLNSFAAEENRLIALNKERLDRKIQSFGSLFNRAALYKELEKEITKEYALQFTEIQRNRDLQLESLEDEQKKLQIRKLYLESQIESNKATSEERQELAKVVAEIQQLEDKKVDVKVEFQTSTGENAAAELAAKRELAAQQVSQIVDDVQSTAQAAAEIGNTIIDAQINALDSKLEQIASRKEAIEAQIEALNEQIAASNNEIEDLQARIEENTGAAQKFFQSSLERELQKRDDTVRAVQEEEKAKISLAKEEFKIAEQQKALAKQQAIIQAVLNAVQFIGAIANTAAQSGAGTPITLPIVLGTITAGLAAVAGFTKLEKGGIVEGPSHSEGGVRGTGRFNNIEVEGGEIVIPKVATANNIELLENIRKQGHVKKFNQGGFLPSQNAIAASSNVNFGNQINNKLNQPIFASITEFNDANNRVQFIESKTSI